jgi:hypothetical protein
MAKKIAGFSMIFLLLLLTGCAPKTAIWTSSPSVKTFSNQYYEATLEALKKDRKGEYDFFVLFRLTVNNQTNKMLEIDWNKSRYIYNDYTRGGLVFKGIKAEDIKNLTIPFDVVSPGHTFSKEIAPVKLVTWARLKDRSIGKDDSGFSPGIIPEGENGIILVVRQNGREIREKITVNIATKEER